MKLLGPLTVLVLLVAAPREASACTCSSPGNRVLLASNTTLAPAAGPWLVLYGSEATVRLTDELGAEWPTESVRRHRSLGLCTSTYDLVRPVTPLSEGALYRLELSSPDGLEATDQREFVATKREPRRVERTLALSLERVAKAGVMSGAGCGSPELEGEAVNGAFAARVDAGQPILLFVEVSVEDSKHGVLAESRPSIDQGPSSTQTVSAVASASVPELVTSAACARVVVRDALDATVYDKELCPKPGETLEESLSVEMPEHLVREHPDEVDEGCSCSHVGSRGSVGSGLWLLVLAALGLGRRARDLASARVGRTL